MATNSTEELYELHVRSLPPNERLRLVEMIARDMASASDGGEPTRGLPEPEGVGAEMWHEIEVRDPQGEPDPHQQAREALIRAGLSSPTPEPMPIAEPISEERREELARLFSRGKPLSEIIIEERDGR
jgi:hypothetical protein